MKKLPPINAYYWALIICATTMGETVGDLISMSMGLGYALSTVILIALFAAALAASVRARAQHPAMYWTVVILASTAGTTLSDLITRSLGLGYGWGVALLFVILAVIFGVWRMLTPALDIKAPMNRKTESLYWSAILISSTLGTAFGDLISNGTGLSFIGGTEVLAGLLLVVAALALLTNISKDICYWLAIVITHPIGATSGDSLVKPDGLNLGPVVASALLIAAFGLVVLIGRTFGNQQSIASS